MEAGEVVLLLGPSGSGKSTLAMTVNGLIPHAIPASLEGSVIIDGLDTIDATVAELGEHVAMVFQDPDAQIVTNTLLDEVCFGPENLCLPVDEILQRAEWALTMVGLWERRSENPDRLSGGGKQRLAIACALALKPKILVLDEPTANLDPVGIDEVYRVLKDIVREGHHAILLIEHNLDAAMSLVDRVIALDQKGRMILDGPLRDVLPTRFHELLAHGVWLPMAGLAARVISNAGVDIGQLPLTPKELSESLNAHEHLPAVRVEASPERSANPVVIQVQNLSIIRHKKSLIQSVNLKVRQGEFLAIIGTNGAGKTTLVRAIAGVNKPPRGAVNTGGLDIGRADPRKIVNQVGFVFQNPEHQFITHTVYDELAHPLRLQNVPEHEVKLRVDEMLQRFGLEQLAQAHPFLLSGGQKRRLSVGTALITGAPILVLDEPTFGQDRDRANELLRILKELNREGTTILVVTHDMQLVVEHANRVAIMQNGSLIASDSTEKIFQDVALIEQAGLKLPPLAQAMRGLSKHPNWQSVVKLSQLPAPQEGGRR